MRERTSNIRGCTPRIISSGSSACLPGSGRGPPLTRRQKRQGLAPRCSEVDPATGEFVTIGETLYQLDAALERLIKILRRDGGVEQRWQDDLKAARAGLRDRDPFVAVEFILRAYSGQGNLNDLCLQGGEGESRQDEFQKAREDVYSMAWESLREQRIKAWETMKAFEEKYNIQPRPPLKRG